MSTSREELNNFMYNVAWLRRTMGISKREMAKRLGVGGKTLDLMEQGRVPPRLSASVIFAVERQFCVDRCALLSRRLGE